MRKLRKTDFIFLGAMLVGIFFIALFGLLRNDSEQELGVTFSVAYAEELGLNPGDVFIGLLDEVGVRKFRFPVYWDRIEIARGQYDWGELDWYLWQASMRDDVEITLAIGQKVPRWPECWLPDWFGQISESGQAQAVLEMISAVVSHIGSNPVVVRWQVENEPFLAFGEGCPAITSERLNQEIDLVRSLDDRPIQLTASGEQEPWLDMAVRADVLGVSMYRLVYDQIAGFAFYPLSPEYYRTKAGAAELLADQVIVSELQAEPWFYKPIEEFSLEEQYQSFDVQAFQDNVKFSEQTGLDESYLWGAEWWYFMKQAGDDRHWEAAKELFYE
ncbi:MAG: hypothetical protein ABIH67_00825 [Candidatus Uhrbacteria bacterium]